jgi:membrane-associated protein
MELLHSVGDFFVYAFDVFMHLDKHLADIIAKYDKLTYLILFAVIFAETGLVVTPFLPGDSLLFAAGAFTTLGTHNKLDVWLLTGLLIVAAILGDTVNYAIGKRVGSRVFERDTRFLKKKHLERTQAFYERYGAKTIVIARFVPIVRTFAPFVAGVGHMDYARFLKFNVLGGVVWVVGFVFAGHFFGNVPIVKENFSLVILAIIALSVAPAVFEYVRARRAPSHG